jgi:hypothetical protein
VSDLEQSRRQWRPTKEYLEQAPRAALLRNLCILAIDAAEAKLTGEYDDGSVVGAILDINARLFALGIESDMHVIEDDDLAKEQKRLAFMLDPVLAAEYAAGQVRRVIEGVMVAKSVSLADLGEHDELQGEGLLPLIQVQSASPRTRAFAVDFAAVGALGCFVDYAAGPSELQPSRP